MLYDTSLKRKWDKQALLEGAIEEGLEKGMKQGLEQGLEQGAKIKQFEIAKALKLEGISTDLISKATGLALQDIENL
jgi:flagellar biosynthesis/type III secretory pathway protein FliH